MDGIANSVDGTWSKLWEMMKYMQAHAYAVHGAAEPVDLATEQQIISPITSSFQTRTSALQGPGIILFMDIIQNPRRVPGIVSLPADSVYGVHEQISSSKYMLCLAGCGGHSVQ